MRKYLLTSMAVAWLALPAAAAAGPAENKAIAERVFLEKLGAGKLDIASQLYADGFVAHAAGQDYDLKEDNQVAQDLRIAFPDLKVAVERSVADGDLVAVNWTTSGTNTVKAGPFPGNGKPVKLNAMTFFRFNDQGRIVEEWSIVDRLGMLQQLGVLRTTPVRPAPAATKPKGDIGR